MQTHFYSFIFNHYLSNHYPHWPSFV